MFVRLLTDFSVARGHYGDGRLLQIARVEPLSEPPVNRSQQFARLPQLALVAPKACKAHGGAALVSLYFGRRAHAPVIGGAITIP